MIALGCLDAFIATGHRPARQGAKLIDHAIVRDERNGVRADQGQQRQIILGFAWNWMASTIVEYVRPFAVKSPE